MELNLIHDIFIKNRSDPRKWVWTNDCDKSQSLSQIYADWCKMDKLRRKRTKLHVRKREQQINTMCIVHLSSKIQVLTNKIVQKLVHFPLRRLAIVLRGLDSIYVPARLLKSYEMIQRGLHLRSSSFRTCGVIDNFVKNQYRLKNIEMPEMSDVCESEYIFHRICMKRVFAGALVKYCDKMFVVYSVNRGEHVCDIFEPENIDEFERVDVYHELLMFSKRRRLCTVKVRDVKLYGLCSYNFDEKHRHDSMDIENQNQIAENFLLNINSSRISFIMKKACARSDDSNFREQIMKSVSVYGNKNVETYLRSARDISLETFMRKKSLHFKLKQISN